MATGERIMTAIVGAGTIGRGFAVLFAAAGHDVAIFDPDRSTREAAGPAIAATLADLDDHGLLEDRPSRTLARIAVHDELASAVCEARFVQECAPERAELKRAIFSDLMRLCPDDAILASASSSMPASRFVDQGGAASRCLIAHPGNPPFLLRVMEIVPAPFTADETVERASAFFANMEIRPILVSKEIEGFVFNRLQGAVLREAYCLVRDGIAEVEDIDAIVREGIGLRWAAVGPFETVDLNTTGGIAEHARRLGPAYARMGAERGQDDPWTPELVKRVADARGKLMHEKQRADHIRRRDRTLMGLLKAKLALSGNGG